jgi:hypothetical protein
MICRFAPNGKVNLEERLGWSEIEASGREESDGLRTLDAIASLVGRGRRDIATINRMAALYDLSVDCVEAERRITAKTLSYVRIHV